MAGLPTSADVVAALASAGVTATEGDCDLALAAAIEQWEAESGYSPFVASDTATEGRLYVPSSGTHTVISLGGGILPTGTITLSLAGEALDSTAYILKPESASRTGKPYTYLKLLTRAVEADSGALTLSGRWGYCADDAVPSLVISALVGKAALEVAEPLQSASARGGDGAVYTKVGQGTVDLDLATSAAERMAALEGWKAQWEKTARIYRRNEVV